jgi:hypothetical protein
MTSSAKGGLSAGLVTVVIAGLIWTIWRDAGSEPYAVPRAALSGWTLEAGGADDPWLIGAHPPEAVSAALFKEVAAKTSGPLVAPRRTSLGLVLRSEYDEGLQGVYGVDAILRMAGNAGIERAAFEPVCVAHRVATDGPVRRELFFVAFTAPEFNQLREDLIPPFPEHAGTGTYDPTTLGAILAIGATDNDFARWFPFTFDRQVDCVATLNIE